MLWLQPTFIGLCLYQSVNQPNQYLKPHFKRHLNTQWIDAFEKDWAVNSFYIFSVLQMAQREKRASA